MPPCQAERWRKKEVEAKEWLTTGKMQDSDVAYTHSTPTHQTERGVELGLEGSRLESGEAGVHLTHLLAGRKASRKEDATCPCSIYVSRTLSPYAVSAVQHSQGAVTWTSSKDLLQLRLTANGPNPRDHRAAKYAGKVMGWDEAEGTRAWARAGVLKIEIQQNVVHHRELQGASPHAVTSGDVESPDGQEPNA
jgi:hypothetical protein